MRSIQFRPEENKGPVIVLIGRRDTGKSFLIRDLLFHHQDVPVATVISGTEAGNGFYSSIVPKLFIHHEYQSVLIENVLRRQKMVVKQYNQEGQLYNKATIDPRNAVVLDDCLYDDKWTRDKLMRALFLNGRHWKVMLIISTQYCMGLSPILRGNLDYVFILRETNYNTRKKLYENYASMFPTFDLFSDVLTATTESFECMVIKNNLQSNQLTDQVFWYKAETRPDYKIGSKEFWEMSKKLTDDDDEIGQEYDPTKIKRKNVTTNLQVRKLK